MIKDSYSGKPYIVNTKYVINRGTKGHRTLHIYNNPSCPASQGRFDKYEEADSVEEAMKMKPIPQKCLKCFPNQ